MMMTTLPVSPAALPVKSETAIRVLLVEDCRLVRVGLRSVLDEAPNIVVVGEVDSGEDALSIQARVEPHVVLVDLGLPGMDGVQTMQRMRERNGDLRFVILTSHETPDEVMQALAAGAHAYCLKNIASDRLVQVIAMVNEGATWLDPGIAAVVQELFQHSPDSWRFRTSALKETLTEREKCILKLMVEGHSNNAIAKKLYISVHTAKFYVSNLLDKLGVSDRVQAAVKAVREGLIE